MCIGTGPLGILAAGLLSEWLGPAAAILTMACFGLAGLGLVWACLLRVASSRSHPADSAGPVAIAPIGSAAASAAGSATLENRRDQSARSMPNRRSEHVITIDTSRAEDRRISACDREPFSEVSGGAAQPQRPRLLLGARGARRRSRLPR